MKKIKSDKTKSAFIPGVRTHKEIELRLMKKMEKYFKGRKINKSEYLLMLIEKDISDDSIINYNCDDKKKYLSISLAANKIGNNVNQIAHGINIIKRKKVLSKDDGFKIINYFKQLSYINSKLDILVKNIKI